MTLLEKKVQIFKALAHPVRLGIVEKLAEGERCV
ncbi:MAG TPA: ArsR family transcriptional regulator, partial [Synergistaceae bacterium]|nr:ArsR family transcriptional regulator [Synergistaceae bacterium]